VEVARTSSAFDRQVIQLSLAHGSSLSASASAEKPRGSRV
jgi:hypothetical protein